MGLQSLTSMNIERLQEIAAMAYGSGRFEGTKGGEGRIGMIDGKVVKFNTHIGERLFGAKATDAMFASCNELRKNLWGIAQDMGLESKQLEKIKSELGLDKSGSLPTKKLLNRTTVASVINILGKENNTLWDKIPDAKMKTADTSFKNVENATGERSRLLKGCEGALSCFENIVQRNWLAIASDQCLPSNDGDAKERFVVAVKDRFRKILGDGVPEIAKKFQEQQNDADPFRSTTDIDELIDGAANLLGGVGMSHDDQFDLSRQIMDAIEKNTRFDDSFTLSS